MATLAETRARSILRGLGLPISRGAVSILVAWQACEGGPANRHNPMNTTLRTAGSAAINSAGVQQYPTEADGISATVATLQGGYPAIVSALSSGSPGRFLAAKGEIALWGTSYGCLSRRLGIASAQAPPGGAAPPNIGRTLRALPPWFGWVVLGIPVGAVVLDAIRRA